MMIERRSRRLVFGGLHKVTPGECSGVSGDISPCSPRPRAGKASPDRSWAWASSRRSQRKRCSSARAGTSDHLAGPREWRTPPLWGIGLLEAVNGHTQLLHDGRARDLVEAILWHGGEAEAPKQRFMALPREDRDAVVAFLRSL